MKVYPYIIVLLFIFSSCKNSDNQSESVPVENKTEKRTENRKIKIKNKTPNHQNKKIHDEDHKTHLIYKSHNRHKKQYHDMGVSGVYRGKSECTRHH